MSILLSILYAYTSGIDVSAIDKLIEKDIEKMTKYTSELSEIIANARDEIKLMEAWVEVLMKVDYYAEYLVKGVDKAANDDKMVLNESDINRVNRRNAEKVNMQNKKLLHLDVLKEMLCYKRKTMRYQIQIFEATNAALHRIKKKKQKMSFAMPKMNKRIV